MKRVSTRLIFIAMLLPLAANCEPQTSAFYYRAVVAAGMTIAGHTFSSQTVFGATALNDYGEFAFVAHWSYPSEQTAIFTSKRLVAKVGDVIDSYYIESIPLDTKIAINNLGQVAFEADYSDGPPSESFRPILPGLFLDSHLIERPYINPFDFRLGNDGQLITEKDKPSLFAGQRNACSLPPFPLPRHWSEAGGAIASYRLETSTTGRRYHADLPYFQENLAKPYRLIYYGADCLPLLVAIGDGDRNVVAAFTERGLLASIDLDGYLDFFGGDGFIETVTDSFTRKSPLFSVNGWGEVLVPLNFTTPQILLCSPLNREKPKGRQK